MSKETTLMVPVYSRREQVAVRPVLIDADDEALLREIPWRIAGGREHQYAYATINGHTTGMHRFLLGLKPGDKRVGDHINGDTLDNRRKNLRACTASEHSINTKQRRRAGFDPLNPSQIRLRCEHCGSRYWKKV